MLTSDKGLRAVEAIFAECFRTFAALPNGMVIDTEEVTGVINDVPLAFFKGIGSARLGPQPDRDVKKVIEMYRARKQPFRWWLSPSTTPSDLVSVLRMNGFGHVYDAGGMAADLTTLALDAVSPQELCIRQVGDAGALAEWATILLTVFARPANEIAIWTDAYLQLGLGDGPWIHYIGYVDGEPVATSSVLLCGELAGVYHVSTAPQVRGRGYGAALTLQTMRTARDRGATEIVLQSSEMGAGVYRGLGFVQYCDLTLYDWRPTV